MNSRWTVRFKTYYVFNLVYRQLKQVYVVEKIYRHSRGTPKQRYQTFMVTVQMILFKLVVLLSTYYGVGGYDQVRL